MYRYACTGMVDGMCWFFVLKLNRTSLFVVLSIHVYMCRTVIMKGRGGAWGPTSLGNLLNQKKKMTRGNWDVFRKNFILFIYKYILHFYILDFLRIYRLCFLFWVKKEEKGVTFVSSNRKIKKCKNKSVGKNNDQVTVLKLHWIFSLQCINVYVCSNLKI